MDNICKKVYVGKGVQMCADYVDLWTWQTQVWYLEGKINPEQCVTLQVLKTQKSCRESRIDTHFLSVDLLLVLRAHGYCVTVSSDTGVLVSRIVVTGRLALEHLAVLWDTVAIALGNGVLAVDGLALSRSPCEVVTADLNVVVCELAELVVIHTKKLSLFGSTELETGDLVDGECEESAHDERVGGDSDDVRDLLVDGGRSAGNGTTLKTSVDSVKSNDVVGTEDAVEEESNHSSDTVLSEHIEGIVNFDPELD